MIRRLKTAKPEVERAEDEAEVRVIADTALADIASRGDMAVRKMPQKFDGYSPEIFQLSEREIGSANLRLRRYGPPNFGYGRAAE